MLRIISQGNQFDMPYEGTILKYSYRKLDDDDEKSETVYAIDAYNNNYEELPVVLGSFSKAKYCEYVINELRKRYNEQTALQMPLAMPLFSITVDSDTPSVNVNDIKERIISKLQSEVDNYFIIPEEKSVKKIFNES